MKRIFRIIISVSVLGISLVGVVFLVWPKYQAYSFLKAQVEARKDRLERGERALAQLKKVQEEVDARREDFAKLDEAIPQDAGLPALYEHIQQLASDSGLVLSSIGGQPTEGPVPETSALVFKAEFAGSYEGLKFFLDEARRSSRIFNVDTVNVSAEVPNSGELKITIELSAYETL